MPKNPNEDLRRYWGIFGDARFTPADLWRWFRGAYYDAGGQDGWPRDDFLEWLALNRKSWIESALGPRGGQGWRISADAVDVCRAWEVFIEHTRECVGSCWSFVRRATAISPTVLGSRLGI